MKFYLHRGDNTLTIMAQTIKFCNEYTGILMLIFVIGMKIKLCIYFLILNLIVFMATFAFPFSNYLRHEISN